MSPTIPPPIGKLVDVDGHRLHIHIMGEGSPTVVFEAGGASWSLDWHLVQTEVAKFTATCSYDRAGFGWSDPGPKPRTSEQIVRELHAALNRAGIKKPYVLVGASFGGHTVRLFARHHPDEVAGIYCWMHDTKPSIQECLRRGDNKKLLERECISFCSWQPD